MQFYRLCRETGIRLRVPEDLADCKAAGLHWCRWVIEKERAPLLRTVRYLKRQRTKDRRADGHILDDYWRIAKSEGYDLSDEHVRFPKDLLRAHDRVTEERRVREEAQRAAAVLKEEMEHAIQLKVPLEADTNMGENWLEAK